MIQNNLKKILVTFLLSILFLKFTFSQTIVFRPTFGSKYLWSNASSQSYFDPSFVQKFRQITYSAVYSAELMYPKGSYEFSFTNQDFVFNFNTNYSKVGGISIKEKFYHRQIQLCYNRFFEINSKNNKNRISIMPIISVGLSFGFNNGSTRQYDFSNEENQGREYSSDFPNEYIDYKLTTRPVNQLAIGGVIKVGAALMIKGVERARLQLCYNPGFNKIAERDYLYYHTSQKYSGYAASYGNQFSVVLSIPIYIKRKK